MALENAYHLSYCPAIPITLPTLFSYNVTTLSVKVKPEDGGSKLHQNVDI
jgi:hypothetical protein